MYALLGVTKIFSVTNGLKTSLTLALVVPGDKGLISIYLGIDIIMIISEDEKYHVNINKY